MHKRNNTLKISAALFILFSLFLVSCKKLDPKKITLNEKLTQEAISQLAPAMMKNLHEKVQSEGYAGAVEFCNIFSPRHGKQKNQEILEEFKKTYGVEEFSIRRISLKNRNPKAAPDKTMTEVLQTWEDDLQKNPAGPVQLETKTYYEDDHYTTMTPIRIPGNFCLGCHGTPETRDTKAYTKIKELYPEDKATDYSVGDLRGAFVVKIKYSK
ncbi:MAG: DUF3365 domain-containing protein [Leptospirales bacterium]